MISSIRLGYHYHVPALSTVKSIFMPGSQGIFIDSLSPYCEKIICFLHSPSQDQEIQCNYLIKSTNVELENIGPHMSVPQRVLQARNYTSALFKRRKDLDVLLIRGPSPLLPAMAKRIPNLPKSLLLVASYTDGIDSLPQPKWRKELIRLWSYWNEVQQIKIASRSLTFVNSASLYSKLRLSVPHLVETKTTTISKSDIYLRADTCNVLPFRILFSGRIASEKGIEDILQAVALLNNQGIDCVLDMVGSFESRKFQTYLMKFIETLGLLKRAFYHGFKVVGSELLEYYRKADVYVIASRASEGFPRTIWEAFSQGTPVIATTVGSIPLYLQHEQNALLVTPYSPNEIAYFIKRIISDSGLRKRLILNGYELVKNNTLDAQAKNLIQNIETWLQNTERA